MEYPLFDLTIQRAAEGYKVSVRFVSPGQINEPSLNERPCNLAPETFEPGEVRNDPSLYGKQLAEQLFSDQRIRDFFIEKSAQARAPNQTHERPPLRFRLRLSGEAGELHRLRWEQMHDPLASGVPLACSQWFCFSRLMESPGQSPVERLRERKLKALIAVSAPVNSATIGLGEPLIAKDEIGRARERLGGIEAPAVGDAAPLTRKRLRDALREGVDILYLLCHGKLEKIESEAENGESWPDHRPWLYLQAEDGTEDLMEGEELANWIRALRPPPVLVVLASCDSAGTHDRRLKAAEREEPHRPPQHHLAQMLADAGVPAVVAMQGQIAVAAVWDAMPAFFGHLQKTGHVEQAMVEARAAIAEPSQAWMPALFAQLRDGYIWYQPGFVGDEKDKPNWRDICVHVHAKEILPIVGPDFQRALLGSTTSLAKTLAEQYGYPMLEHEMQDLATVAQYVATTKGRTTLQTSVMDVWRDRLKEAVPGANGDVKALLDLAVEARQNDPSDCSLLLSLLNAPVYVCATPETTLSKMVRRLHPDCQPVIANWRDSSQKPVGVGDAVRSPEHARLRPPTPETPIVYYAFGTPLTQTREWVVTEDDYFDYLIASASHQHRLVPKQVSEAWNRCGLFFLGFPLRDWAFRVLFRLIASFPGGGQSRPTSIGVQVHPDEYELRDVKKAEEYLREYFKGQNELGVGRPPISVYWGSPLDFLQDLHAELPKHEEAFRDYESPFAASAAAAGAAMEDRSAF